MVTSFTPTLDVSTPSTTTTNVTTTTSAGKVTPTTVQTTVKTMDHPSEEPGGLSMLVALVAGS